MIDTTGKLLKATLSPNTTVKIEEKPKWTRIDNPTRGSEDVENVKSLQRTMGNKSYTTI